MQYWTLNETAGIAVAAFCNPPVNYFTDAAVREFADLLENVSDMDDVRALVFCGDGAGHFVTHFDAEEILDGVSDPERTVFRGPVRNIAVNAALGRIAALPFPVIAALDGDAMGFGMELALACDLRIAQRGRPRYGLPEVRLGIVPGSGGMQRLARIVGLATALDLVLRARVVDADRAEELGLVTEAADDAYERALEIAGEVSRMPRLPVALAKRALHTGADAPLPAALVVESDANVRAKLGPDAPRVLREYLDRSLDDRRAWLLDE